MKVLIIDDDPQILKYISQRLEKWGYQSESVKSGIDAIKILSEKSFNLILMDIYLGETTAVDLIPKIKQIAPNVRIVTMTGQNSRELEMKIRSQGILYYMVKPIENSNLKTLLDHIKAKIQKN